MNINKLKRIALSAVAVATVAATLSGCASKGAMNTKSVSQVKTETHALQNLGYEVMQQPISEADFAFNLGGKLFAEVSDADNFVYSPLSVWLPLAALVNATDAEHKSALLSALSANGVTDEQLNNYAQTLLYRVTGEGNREYID